MRVVESGNIPWNELRAGEHVLLQFPAGHTGEYVVSENGWLRQVDVGRDEEDNLKTALKNAGYLRDSHTNSGES